MSPTTAPLRSVPCRVMRRAVTTVEEIRHVFRSDSCPRHRAGRSPARGHGAGGRAQLGEYVGGVGDDSGAASSPREALQGQGRRGQGGRGAASRDGQVLLLYQGSKRQGSGGTLQ